MLALAVAFLGMAGQPAASSSLTEDLTEIEERIAATWKAGDCDAWGALVAPEWSVIHITGTTMTRAEALQMCRSPQAPIADLRVDDVSTHPYGDTAVVRGRTTMTIGGANPQTITLRFTDVFVRRDGRWQVVASHATRLAP